MDVADRNPFDEVVPQAEGRQQDLNRFAGVVEALAAAITSRLREGDLAKVETGFESNLGIQHRLAVTLASHNLTDYLLEVHIRPDGSSATVNLYDNRDWASYQTPDELTSALVATLQHGPLHDRLQTLINLSAAAA